MPSKLKYCPYCNNTNSIQLTDEHVIPEAIGGDQRTVIKACVDCNSKVGEKIDTLLSRDGWFRLNTLFAKGYAKRQDRLQTTTKLKDGRTLEGYFYFIPTNEGYLPGFEPKKIQPDGSVWLSEAVVKKSPNSSLKINVFKRDMVEYWGFYCPPAKENGLEPAMIKVLLGIIYIDQGIDVLRGKSFDVLRYCLNGALHPLINYRWLDEPMVWGNSTVKNHEHAVYFECPEGNGFKAGVALFGTGISFQIDDFGQKIPKRCIIWEGRPGPPKN
jgi:hypothetical protein